MNLWLVFFSKILLMCFSGGVRGRSLKFRDLSTLLCFWAGNRDFPQTPWDFTIGFASNGLKTTQKDVKLHSLSSFKALKTFGLMRLWFKSVWATNTRCAGFVLGQNHPVLWGLQLVVAPWWYLWNLVGECYCCSACREMATGKRTGCEIGQTWT